jgi:MinD-like ATPase involved in chromosome partitioning or flagellar assembly
MGDMPVHQCALPGCDVMIEELPGRPARKYCSAAHRAAGRRLRNGQDDEVIEAELMQRASADRVVSRTPVATPAQQAADRAHQLPSRSATTPAPPPSPPPLPPKPAPPRQDSAPSRPERLTGTGAIPAAGPPQPPPNALGPGVGGYTVPPVRPELISQGPGLTDDMIVRRRSERPTMGWRRAVFSASGGRINPGLSAAEAARNELLVRLRRHLPGAHQIAVSSLKGGVGKTTVSAVLGLTLAQHRGDRVVALDANPDAGTLADRLTGEIGVTVRQMLENIDSIDSLTAVSHYTSLAGRLQVLASEQDPAMSEAFNRSEYEQICAVLARFYNIIITDSGTGLVHSAMEGTLALADSLVVVGAPTVDGASRASKTLDWLVVHGYAEQVADAVVVLCCDRVSPEIDRDRVRAHFLGRSRAVVEIPYDPHLATGGRLDLGAMRDETRLAFLELGALIADRFAA